MTGHTYCMAKNKTKGGNIENYTFESNDYCVPIIIITKSERQEFYKEVQRYKELVKLEYGTTCIIPHLNHNGGMCRTE